MNAKTVLVLGGGVGGLVAANRLRAALPREHRVILLDRESRHLFQPSLLWLAVGSRETDRIQRPLERLRRKGIEVVQVEIEQIDLEAMSVQAGGRELVGDALIISLGADLVPESIPGLADTGHNLFTLAGALSLRAALRDFRGGRLVILTAAPAYKCPAAPYEAAMLIEHYCRRQGTRGEVTLALYAAEPGPLGVAGPEVSAAVRQIVEAKGIHYHPEHQVTTVDPAGRRVSFANGTTAGYDLLAYVPAHRAPVVVRRAGLVGDGGWVSVDRHTLETSHAGVFAIGDMTAIPLTIGKPLPKAGVFAHAQAEVVAANLVNRWTGGAKQRSFDGYGQCFLETGGGRAGLGAGNFYGEPAPNVKLHAPSRRWHWGKVFFEWRWLRQWF